MKRKNFVDCNAELVKIRMNIESLYYDSLPFVDEQILLSEIHHSLNVIEKYLKGEE